MIEITIKRDEETILMAKPSGGSSQSKKIMGDNIVALTFELNRIVKLRINDTAEVFGETYRINKAPVVTKKDLYRYEYTVSLQSLQYDLKSAQYMFYDSGNILQEGDFSLTGTAQTFIDLMVNNINRISSGWTRGAVSTTTDYKTLTFSKEDCLTVLSRLAKEFDTEYSVVDKVINLSKLATQTNLKFRYGRGKGLYEITRTQPDNQTVITRLYAFGAEKNLPAGYPSLRLRLPGGFDSLVHNVTWDVTGMTYTFFWDLPLNGATEIEVIYRRLGSTAWHNYSASNVTTASIPFPGTGTFEVQFATVQGGVQLAITPIVLVTTTSAIPVFAETFALPYLEQNTALYGIREGDYINDDIYPHRTGTVSSVDALDVFSFNDNDIDFDVNGYLLPGTAAKLTFVTGQLSGYPFDISAFDNVAKKFTILKNKDEKTLDIPNGLLKPAIGDKYVLTDISMPINYVQAAESLLQSKAQEYLDANSSPAYQYSVICDPKYFRRRRIKMNIGDIVWIQDTELEIDKYIRVVSVTKSLLDEFEYSLELGETVSPGTIESLRVSTVGNTSDISNTQRAIDQNKLLNGVNIGDLRIQQGTLVIENIPSNSGTPLKIDSNGRLCI